MNLRNFKIYSLENTLYSSWPPNTSKHDLVFRLILVLRNQRPNAKIPWIIEKAREFQKTIYFGFIDDHKDFDSLDYNKLWRILKEMGIPDNLTCLLRNLYTGQEATVRTGHGTTE